MKTYLEFESEIKLLEEQLEVLKEPFGSEGITEVNTEKISELQNKINQKLDNIYSKLNRWQRTLVARHEERPKAKFFIENLFTDFINLSGDRKFGEDKALISGFAKFEGRSVLVLGQEKGEDLQSRLERNFGMLRPEGYRTAIRLMKLADKFNIPVISFIDTPGAYPGIGAEQRGQAEAIASSIDCCMSLEVPIVSIIIGEGGSGGAIALASANKVIMLQNSIYSVISPEGCASILWKDPGKSLEAAEAMKLSAADLLKNGVIDEIIPEPIGGAHRDKEQMVFLTKEVLKNNLNELNKFNRQEILDHRKTKFLKIGIQKSIFPTYDPEKFSLVKGSNIINYLSNFFSDKKKMYFSSIFILFMLLIFGLFFF